MTSNFVIEIDDLHKAYGDYSVLRGLSLRVGAGETYGLIGQNGAGKTTLIHVLLGLLRPTSGRVRVLGVSPLRASGRIGYLPERLRYHLRFSAREYLRFLGQFDDMPAATLRDRVEQLLALVELSTSADRTMTTYSKGMLQRVGVAQALLSDPDLLLIDEPTSGLDPAGQRDVLDILAAVRGRGHTIFLCTHYFSEIELLCDRVGVLSDGRLGAEAEVRDLRSLGSSVAIRVDALHGELRAALNAIGPEVECREDRVLIRPNTPELQAHVLRTLLDGAASVIALEPLESPLEELFARTTAGQRTAPAPTDPTGGMPDFSGMARPLPAPAFAPSDVGPVGDTASADAPPRAEGDTLLRELLRRKEENAATDQAAEDSKQEAE